MARRVNLQIVQVADCFELPVRLCTIQHVFLECGCSKFRRVAVFNLINGALIPEIVADPV